MNITIDMTSDYMILSTGSGQKTNPIQTQLKPIQTQFNPKQTQFKANKANIEAQRKSRPLGNHLEGKSKQTHLWRLQLKENSDI